MQKEKKKDWCPYIEILTFPPVAEGKFSLDKLIVCKLKVLAGATVFSVRHVVSSRPIEFGLHIADVCESYVHTNY